MENEEAASASVVSMASGLVITDRETFKHNMKLFLIKTSNGSAAVSQGFPVRDDGADRIRAAVTHTHGVGFFLFSHFSRNKPLIKGGSNPGNSECTAS